MDQALEAFLDASLDAVLVMDDAGRCLRANIAAQAVLGRSHHQLIGTDPLASWQVTTDRGVTTLRSTEGRVLRARQAPIEQGKLVVLRDITEAERLRQRLSAFASAASSVAYAGSLRETLDAICAETIRTVDLAAAQILLIDADTWRMQLHGAAPVELFGPDFAERILHAAAQGAELTSVESLRQGVPIITPGRRSQMLRDPRWRPLHDHLLLFDWDTFVSMPLGLRQEPIGALNIYCRPGQPPTVDDLEFFTAMADHISVAVQQAQLFAASTARTQREERQRLARDLHDSACQELFSINLHVRAAQFLSARMQGGTVGSPEAWSTLGRHLATVGDLAHAALEDLRALVFELYPTVLQDEGLVMVARQLITSIGARESIRVELMGSTLPLDELQVEGEALLEAYHILRESLHNVVKHARASTVQVTLGVDPAAPTTLVMEIADDGIGPTWQAQHTGLGLTSMRDRAERLGGSLRVGAGVDGGTTVRAVLPHCVRWPGKAST